MTELHSMPDISNNSTLRYGFDLDKNCFLDIGTNAQLILSLFNTFVCHPFPLFILIRKSPTMTKSIRRGYIAMHIAFIVYEVVFFFLARIYVLLPYPGLYCEGPLCRLGLSKGVILGFISFSIVLIQIPFAFLIISMHQMFMPDNSPFKLSKGVKITVACVQITIMSLNFVGFIVFGEDPDNYDDLIQEPELAFYDKRGRLLLFGSPGNPQYFRYELVFFYFTLIVNFSVLCFCIFHSIICLKKISQEAKSTQTQLLTKKMYEVFFWQLHGSVLNHVLPLTAFMVFMYLDASILPPALLAVMKLVLLLLFTLNSTQFCAIFVFKNSANRKLLADYIWTALGYLTSSKVGPMRQITPIKRDRERSLSMTIQYLDYIISCAAGIGLMVTYWLVNLMLYLPVRRETAFLIYVSQNSSGSALFSYTTGKLFIVLNRLTILKNMKVSAIIYRGISGAYYVIYFFTGISSNIVAYTRLKQLSHFSTAFYKQQKTLTIYTITSTSTHLIFALHQFTWSFSFITGDQEMLFTVRQLRDFLYDITIFFDPVMLLILSKQVRNILYRRIFERKRTQQLKI